MRDNQNCKARDAGHGGARDNRQQPLTIYALHLPDRVRVVHRVYGLVRSDEQIRPSKTGISNSIDFAM